MKIVTNIQFYAVGGIAQYLATLIAHNEKRSQAHIYGVDVVPPAARTDAPQFDPAAMRHFTLLTRRVTFPAIGEALKGASSLEDVRRAYQPVIDAYFECLREIKPDCIIVSGTYAIPWALLQAARRWGRAPIVIHYHGVLTKETEHWNDPRAKAIMAAMEREFDLPHAMYIFPSETAQATVESFVFGHPIANAAVIPNPVPEHFFRASARRGRKRSVGMVSRWSKIKNVDFLMSLARHAKRTDKNFSFPIITNLSSDHKDYAQAQSVLDIHTPIPHDKLSGFYKTLGVLILPSHFETYGNVAQEALAVGTPVLVSAAAGVAETFHAIGLGGWVHDFTSTAAALEAAAHIAVTTVPYHARALLRLSFSTGPIFTTYFKTLRDWC